MREIVIPGEEIYDKKAKTGFGAYVKKDKVYSSIYGIPRRSKNFVKVVPLHGRYIPRKGHTVIGVVEALHHNGCFVDINSAYNGYLHLEDHEDYQPRDVVMTRIEDVSPLKKVRLGEPKSLYSGKLIEIQPVKIPRVIGRKGSMLRILRKFGNCLIFVGRNGRIYVKGDTDQVKKVEEALKTIEKEAHTYGLTARVKEFLQGDERK